MKFTFDITRRYGRSQLRRYHDEGEDWRIVDDYFKVIDRVEALKPGARRLLLMMHHLFERKDFYPVNRLQLAAAIKHTKLHHHDLSLLKRLIEAGLIKVRRFPLTKTHDDLPRGFEYRYAMNIDTGWILSQQGRTDEYAFKPQREAKLTGLAKFEQEREASKPRTVSKPQKEYDLIASNWHDSLPWYERLIDWLIEHSGLAWLLDRFMP